VTVMDDPFLDLESLYRQCDATDAQFDAWEASRAQKVIRRTYEPQQQSAMNTDMQTKWDAWCQAHIARAFDNQPLFSKAQKLVIGEVISRLRAEWRKEIAEAVGQVKADVEILRVHTAKADPPQDSTNVTPITRPQRDVA
jgi:hypothetical protein